MHQFYDLTNAGSPDMHGMKISSANSADFLGMMYRTGWIVAAVSILYIRATSHFETSQALSIHNKWYPEHVPGSDNLYTNGLCYLLPTDQLYRSYYYYVPNHSLRCSSLPFRCESESPSWVYGSVLLTKRNCTITEIDRTSIAVALIGKH